MRPGRAAVLVLAALAVEGAQAAAGPAPRARAVPRLLLFVSVDQMRFDYLTRFASLFQGGLKRLVEEGAVFSNAYYRHANTETGPGHALLLSGRHAWHTGIIANQWYDALARRSINVVEDPVHAPLPGPGRGASPSNFLGTTIGDRLKHRSAGSRVVGVAMKDRSAVLMGGRRADAAYWYQPKAGRFGSSTYYMSALPGWLEAWNRQGHPERLQGRTWNRLLPDADIYLRLAGEDDVRGEWDGQDTVFPHVIRGAPPSPLFYDDLRRTPFADELTLAVALQALEAHELGRDENCDVLAIGFSATDVIGHTYGPRSQELMDQILRLDRMLGRLFEAAEARAGRDGLLIVLSADHGAMPLVESLQASGVDARRVHPELIEKAVRRELEAAFPGASALIAAYDAPHFYLDLWSIRRQGLKRESVEAVIEKALLATGLVQRVYTHQRLLGDPPPDDPDFALFRNSFFEPRSPHVIACLRPYVYVDTYRGGTGHGTVHEYDRHVPVAFLGARIKPGRYDADCGPQDIAPTLAALLGLDYALEDGQRVLAEMLGEVAAGAGNGGR